MNRVFFIFIVIISFVPGLLFAEIDTLWTNKYEEYGFQNAESVLEISDGGYIFTGEQGGHIYVARTNLQGEILWVKSYIDTAYTDPYFMSKTDGGYIICGRWGGNIEKTDIYILKIDYSGDSLWAKTFGADSLGEVAFCIKPTSDGGYILVGDTFYDIILLKTDSLGNIEWLQCYGGDGWDSGNGVVETDDGGYLVVGYGDYASILLVDSLGNEITHINDGMEYYSVIKSIDGDYVAAGAKWHSYGEYYTLYIAKFDSELNLLDWKEYGAFGDWSIGYSIDNTSDGGYIIGGETGPALFYEDGYVLKVDADLEKQWDMTFDVPNTQVEIFSVKETSDSCYIAAGMNGNYAWLLKLGEVQDVVSGDSTNIPNNYITLTSYPNPFNSTTEIKYYLPTNQNITLEIYDLFGRKVETLYNGKQTAGYHKVNWNAKDYPSGIYFCKLTSAGKSVIKKMTLLK